MVVATIEVWPNGKQENARSLGVVLITNDGTGTQQAGNYDVILAHSGKYFGRFGAWKTGKVERHRRSLSPYHLLYASIGACIKRS